VTVTRSAAPLATVPVATAVPVIPAAPVRPIAPTRQVPPAGPRVSPAAPVSPAVPADPAVGTGAGPVRAQPVTGGGFDPNDPVFVMHRGGKLAVHSTVPLSTREDLSMAYTPGVARVCEAIAVDEALLHTYTWVGSAVAVVTDGSAVLGLGNIGPRAAMPVMEGKAVLFKQFGNVDAVPICLDTQDPDEIVTAVKALAPSFGGINLEDISAPRCFDIERRLVEALDIPVFHDDQHGTAIVVLAALRNAAAVLGRSLSDLRVVISGAGAAGVAVTKMLIAGGVEGAGMIVCDSRGSIYSGRADLNDAKRELAQLTNPGQLAGGISAALRGADVLVGLSGGAIAEDSIAGMRPGGIIFALANPTPEVHPDLAGRYAAVVATGRSDFPNQINNVLAFPGVFRGALDAGATRITEGMKVAAATAIAETVSADLRPHAVVPSALDPRVASAVASAVAATARDEGVCRNR
jgi:malate dehydrogenase (oxaloacetate-decarboxylating)